MTQVNNEFRVISPEEAEAEYEKKEKDRNMTEIEVTENLMS